MSNIYQIGRQRWISPSQWCWEFSQLPSFAQAWLLSFAIVRSEPPAVSTTTPFLDCSLPSQLESALLSWPQSTTQELAQCPKIRLRYPLLCPSTTLSKSMPLLPSSFQSPCSSSSFTTISKTISRSSAKPTPKPSFHLKYLTNRSGCSRYSSSTPSHTSPVPFSLLSHLQCLSIHRNRRY